jgi:serine/threonine protein kinase
LSAAIHDNIVKIIGFGKLTTGSNDYFMVSEYVGSKTMRTLIQDYDFDEITWDDRERLMIELLQAVAHLQNLDICHHDIKPENILVSDRGHACVADFGMSTQSHHSIDLRKQGKGTFTYVAPETFNDEMNSKSDTWSLGVLFYEWCTHGEQPFFGKNEIELKQHIRNSPPLEFNNRYSVPSIWSDIILKHMLDKDYHSRWTAEQVLEHLIASRTANPSKVDTSTFFDREYIRNHQRLLDQMRRENFPSTEQSKSLIDKSEKLERPIEPHRFTPTDRVASQHVLGEPPKPESMRLGDIKRTTSNSCLTCTNNGTLSSRLSSTSAPNPNDYGFYTSSCTPVSFGCNSSPAFADAAPPSPVHKDTSKRKRNAEKSDKGPDKKKIKSDLLDASFMHNSHIDNMLLRSFLKK